MGRFLNLDWQALTAEQKTRLEAYVDEVIHNEWLFLKEGAEFDSTSAPWYSGQPYPAPAAKLALFEWYYETVAGRHIRGWDHEKARDAVTTPEF